MTISQDKNIPYETFGSRIKHIRESNGLNQTQFAEIIGVKQSFVSKVEKNNANFTVDQVIHLKTIFEFDANWLLTGQKTVQEAKPIDRETRIINQMLEGMTAEQKAEVRKYAEDKKLFAELLAERQARKAG